MTFSTLQSQQPAHSESHVLNPTELLQRVGITEGMFVADCGAGADGVFTFAAATLIGAQGTVYALDVVKTAVELLTQKASRLNVTNVLPIWTDLEMYGATKAVRNGIIDIAVLSNTLFQSPDHAGMLTEIARMLKPGGVLLVIDWKPVEAGASAGMGPVAEQRVSPEQVQVYAPAAGLEVVDAFDAGEYHWALVLKKK